MRSGWLRREGAGVDAAKLVLYSYGGGGYSRKVDGVFKRVQSVHFFWHPLHSIIHITHKSGRPRAR